MTEATLLTSDPTPEEVARQKARDAMLERVRTIVFDVWLKGYRDGDVDLETMLRQARKHLSILGDQRLLERALGSMVDQALSSDPPKRGRGNKGQPKVLRKLAADMVDVVAQEEGLSITRNGKAETAFERTSQLLTDLNLIGASARQVESWYYSRSNTNRTG